VMVMVMVMVMVVIGIGGEPGAGREGLGRGVGPDHRMVVGPDAVAARPAETVVPSRYVPLSLSCLVHLLLPSHPRCSHASVRNPVLLVVDRTDLVANPVDHLLHGHLSAIHHGLHVVCTASILLGEWSLMV
jgi:hypothetical protein